MTARSPRRYDRAVAAVRDALRRAAAGFALLLGIFYPVAAGAASSTFIMGDQSVVSVWAGARSIVTVKGWDRPNVQVDTDDEGVQITRRPITFGTPQTPLSVSIPPIPIVVAGTGTRGTLPPEEFPYASDFRPGVHDSVRIVTGPDSHLTVMVPVSTTLLDTRIRGGSGIISIEDYHGGTLFVTSNGGRTLLTDVMTSAFVQMLNGRLEVIDSSFDRLRARGNAANFVFEHNRARQIEVTTVSGPIVYDNGTFDPGLARFESSSGSIGIGVASNAQVAARSSEGRVYTLWDRRTAVELRGDNDANAMVGGGGPVVNAVSGRGNVYVYDGALASRPVLPPEWRVIRQAITQPFAQRAPVGQRQQFQQPAQLLPQAPPPFQRFRALRGRG
jgi:hypothetical protein